MPKLISMVLINIMSGLEKVFAFELYLLNFESLRKRHGDTVD